MLYMCSVLSNKKDFELLDHCTEGKFHYDHYCLQCQIPVEQIVLQPGETDAVKWATFSQVHQMIQDKQICPVIARQFLRHEPALLARQRGTIWSFSIHYINIEAAENFSAAFAYKKSRENPVKNVKNKLTWGFTCDTMVLHTVGVYGFRNLPLMTALYHISGAVVKYKLQ